MSAIRSSGRRLTATATIGGLVAAPLTLIALTSAPAVAADDVVVNLIGVNDFHGRVNADTTKWATTVESLRNASATDTDVFVGAGDLIGASEFTSSVQNDQPTIDVLNAVGLDASAVGNHEFDRGWADLRDRVVNNRTNASWQYLGANVYQKGTLNPVLPEYAEFDAQGIKVAVIGAVTEETPSLVTPAGVADLDFGDPVLAVDRVAKRLSDGDAANGEADVIVATFHSGAAHGQGSDYAKEAALAGEFQRMASLPDSVDAIFNGHTHQVYAWDAPKPGGGTRPILQTGEYAANVGQIQLTVDPATGEVKSYQAKNHARAATADLSNPVVAQVDSVVKAAQAKAAEIGNQPIGKLTADVTRAYSGVDASGKPVEDRGAESTLGDLVANALRDGVPAEIADPDIGIVNPGGLRADLLFKGDPAANPANTDGVITYGEANNVLPFVNNVWTVELTGAQLRKVLEQQWQPAGTQRPYLNLGLSDNVEVTQDPSKPAGSRITSVRINDEWLDDKKSYTVSTFSFLGTGGDNFTAFKDGKAKDTGLVDRDVWVKYLRDHPVTPDFARQQVEVRNLKDRKVTMGEKVRATVSGLDMTSNGAPKNTTVEVVRVRKDKRKVMKTVKVTNGEAKVNFAAPAGTAIELVAQPSGTTITRELRKTRPNIKQVRVFPKVVKANKTRPRVKVVVKANNDGKVAGRVKVVIQGKGVKRKAFGELTKVKGKPRSKVNVRLPRLPKPGAYTVRVKYLGNNKYNPQKKNYNLRVTRR